MKDPVGRRKARLLLLIFIVTAAVAAWSFLREPAGKRCARIADAERDRQLRAAASAVGPDPRGGVTAVDPRPADSRWYERHCRDGKPR